MKSYKYDLVTNLFIYLIFIKQNSLYSFGSDFTYDLSTHFSSSLAYISLDFRAGLVDITAVKIDKFQISPSIPCCWVILLCMVHVAYSRSL